MAKFFGALVTLAAAVALTIVTWPQLFGLSTTVGIAQVTAMRGLFAACCAGAALLFLLLMIARPLRAFAASMMVLLLLAAGANIGILALRGIAPATATAPESSMTVLAWNTLGAAPGTAQIARLGQESGADIIALPETKLEQATEIAAAMTASGSPMRAYTASVGQISAAHSTSVLLSPRLGEYRQVLPTEDGLGDTRVLPSLVMRPVSGTGPTIIAAHAVAPVTDQMENWRADLDWLASQCEAPDVIMAGDFNATLDHMAGMGTVPQADLGACRDAARASGAAGLGTWPTSMHALLGAPIDHVFTTAGWRVLDARVYSEFDGSGSDHRPLSIRLGAIPAG